MRFYFRLSLFPLLSLVPYTLQIFAANASETIPPPTQDRTFHTDARRRPHSTMSRAATSAHDALEDTSIKFQETTRDALQAVRQSGPIQRYLMPTVDYIRDKYRRSPTVVKIVLMTFAALSAIPLACFVGFMGVVTLGCLIVGGIAFTIVEVSNFSLFSQHVAS
ncbi:hypothetical protein BC939DRAFT_226227 [Gamsiella multidivaricata]|uniref:uncharacterized protein n=1 Tax=Gamsiella multidivaricata TaxID=101098 RepID=UPI00221F1EEE|nr:uncharacterized protein BC939DRAFT_226227 [Gamsiella multidivaricata]KAI7831310.1 hypothetical protein BC939DRAFT_226227 [Gamsiella multidivaricata]